MELLYAEILTAKQKTKQSKRRLIGIFSLAGAGRSVSRWPPKAHPGQNGQIDGPTRRRNETGQPHPEPGRPRQFVVERGAG